MDIFFGGSPNKMNIVGKGCWGRIYDLPYHLFIDCFFGDLFSVYGFYHAIHHRFSSPFGEYLSASG